MFLKKRGSVSGRASDSPSVSSVSESTDDSKRQSFSLKNRITLSFRKPKDVTSLASPLPSSEHPAGTATPEPLTPEPHPYENADNLPDRSNRVSRRKSTVWKDPATNDINEVLRARAKSVIDKEGHRVQLGWSAANGKS